jgi:cold shock protein
MFVFMMCCVQVNRNHVNLKAHVPSAVDKLTRDNRESKKLMISSQVYSGKTTQFDVAKGFGFIEVDDTSIGEVFVHQTELIQQGFRLLEQGQLVEFRIGISKESGKLIAVEVKLLDAGRI